MVVDVDGERSFKVWGRQGARTTLSFANARYAAVPARWRGTRRGLGRRLRQRQPAPPRRARVSPGDRPTVASADRRQQLLLLLRAPVRSSAQISAGHRAVQQRRLRHRPYRRSQGAWHPYGRPLVQDPRYLSDELAVSVLFSSNYALYGDMSARANAIYRGFSPSVEIYSIDESFLDVSDIAARSSGRRLRVTFAPPCWPGPACRPASASGRPRRWPSSPTMSPRKTPASAASATSPTRPHREALDGGDQWLEEVWGIGPEHRRRSCTRSAAERSPTCATLILAACQEWPDRRRSPHRPRAAGRGRASTSKTIAPTRKGCAVTRSFSRRVEDLTTMEQAVATHATRLGEKLRRGWPRHRSRITVFFHTSEHDRTSPQRSASTVVTLPEATSDTLVLAQARRPRAHDACGARVTGTARPG